MAPKEKVKVVTGGEGAGITTEERKMYFLSGYHVERKGNGETVQGRKCYIIIGYVVMTTHFNSRKHIYASFTLKKRARVKY